MTNETAGTSRAIGNSLITATYATAIADAFLDLLERLANARRTVAAERAEARIRAETARIVARIPCEVRSDIGVKPCSRDRRHG